MEDFIRLLPINNYFYLTVSFVISTETHLSILDFPILFFKLLSFSFFIETRSIFYINLIIVRFKSNLKWDIFQKICHVS